MPPYLGLALGVAAVSSAAVIIRLAGEAPALVIGVYRLTIASLVVLPAALLFKHRDLEAYDKRSITIALLSGAFLALHFAFWITSLDFTSVASSVVLVTTSPLMIAPLSRWLTGDAVCRRTVFGILLALLGVGTIAFGAGRPEFGDLAGDGLALLGAAAMAGHRITGRRLRRDVSVMAFISVAYPVAAVLLMMAAWVSGSAFSGFAPATYWWLLLLGLLPQVLGHSLLNWSLGHLSAVIVSTAVMAEPAGATVLAYFFLSEAPGPHELVGGAIVLAGVYLAVGGEKNNMPQSTQGRI